MPESISRFEDVVTQFLLGLGYPASSIVREPLLLPGLPGRQYRPDIGILDPAAREYLAVIEVKGVNDSATIIRASDQLRHYVNALGSRPVDAFVAVPGSGPEAISFYRLTAEDAFTLIRSTDFPRYTSFRTTSVASSRTAVRADIQRTTDRFRVVAWSVSFLALLLAAADFALEQYLHISLLSAERLALLGIAAALVLVPYAAKLKAFGLEFERITPPAASGDLTNVGADGGS